MRSLLSLIVFAIAMFSTGLMAQNKKSVEKLNKEGYKFEKIYDVKTTSVKDQYKSGTCWCFSNMSFLESEMIKAGEKPVDLSEMFIVRNCYSDKAIKDVRLHGDLNFGGGGSDEDIFYTIRKYGLVPESVYGGLNYGEKKHVHGELDAVLAAYVKAVIENKNHKISTAWHRGFDAILDAYLGKYPDKFTFEGKEYTPKTFAKERVGLNPDNYISISSFSHHPYNSKFSLEMPDNWLWGKMYNVNLDDFTKIMHKALKEGYSFVWGADVSDKGFSFRKGIAIIPEDDIDSMEGSERSRWEKMTKEERTREMYSFDKPVKQKIITQEMRQQQFDNYMTTADHSMQIVGMYKDQNGTIYYKVKNSWNVNNPYKGYFYASESFVKLKTMNITINKNALPKDIKNKLGIK